MINCWYWFNKTTGDNTVVLLSQIGWTEKGTDIPNKRIPMRKIFVNVDTDGGNGGGIFIVEILPNGSNIFHTKANHRQPVCDKVIEFLEE